MCILVKMKYLRRILALKERPSLLPGLWNNLREFSVLESNEAKPNETSVHKIKKKTFGRIEDGVPESADVVVIGGGSIGCSTAYHLAKLNIGKIVLLERESLTAGTTWHAAGIYMGLRGNQASTRMAIRTRDLSSRILQEETGVDAGWIQTGSIFITRSKYQLDELEKKSLMAAEFGVESRTIDVEEISHLHPLLNTDGLVGGIYSPHDGSLDPFTLCTSYVKAATRYGAEVFEGCEVKNIHTDQDIMGLKQVVAVETSHGTIKTNIVVNCTGIWAPYLAKMVGLEVPQVIYKHTYVITEGIPGMETVPHIRDTEGANYYKRQGDALLFGGDEKNPALVDVVEKNFAFGLYDVDWEKFEQQMTSAIGLMPSVATVGVRSAICGPESYTSDGSPLMGESPNVKGFFHACGFSGGGIMLGGGAGEQLAHWVAYGSPTFDMSSCDINRFSSSLVRNRSWLVETCHEYFISRYFKHHPNLQPLAGRNLRPSPLHEIHLKNGAFFNCIHGWEVPAYFIPGSELHLLKYDYSGYYGNKKHMNYPYRDQRDKDCSFKLEKEINDQIRLEVFSAKNSVALFDLSHLSKFQLSAESVDEAVRALFMTDVSELDRNRHAETLMLTKDGKILSLVNVYKAEDGSYWITAPSQLQDFILRHVNQFLQDSSIKCTCEDVTEKYALIHLRGAKSYELLRSVSSDIPESQKQGMKTKIAEKNVILHRSSHSETPMCDVQCKSHDAIAVYEKLMNSEIKPRHAGTRALKSLSLEKGLPHLLQPYLLGADPCEFKAKCMLSMGDGGDFVGKTKDKRIEYKLIRLSMTPDHLIFPGDCIWRDDVFVGVIEEAAYGFISDNYYVTGYIRIPQRTDKAEEYVLAGRYTVGKPSQKVQAHVKHN